MSITKTELNRLVYGGGPTWSSEESRTLNVAIRQYCFQGMISEEILSVVVAMKARQQQFYSEASQKASSFRVVA